METISDDNLIAIVVGTIIWLLILFSIIRSATNSNHILRLQRMQVELLKEIALKNDVAPERVEAIIKEHNK